MGLQTDKRDLVTEQQQRWKLRLLILDYFSFLIYAFNAINFPLSRAFTVYNKFWKIVFSLSFKHTLEFKNSLTYMLLRIVLFNLQHFRIFQLSFVDFPFNSIVN